MCIGYTEFCATDMGGLYMGKCGVNASSASECYDWPGVDVFRQRVLNSYMLIPVNFLLRSHTAEFRQFTGNVTTSHTGKLPERIYQYFWIGPVHTWSLYGNLPVIFRKSLYVWKGLLFPPQHINGNYFAGVLAYCVRLNAELFQLHWRHALCSTVSCCFHQHDKSFSSP